MKTPILTLITLLIAGLVVHSARADVTVTYSTNAPITAAVSNPVTGYTTLSWKWTTDSPTTDQRDVGQTFAVAESFTLDEIVLFTPGASATSTNRNFTLIIESFATNSVTSARTTVSSQTGVLPHLGSGNRYVSFSLDTPVVINTNITYGFRLSFDDPNAVNSMTFFYTLQTAYPNGTAYNINYSSSSTPAALNSDMAFYLVPEPSVFSLAGLGLLCLFLFQRRNLRN